MPSRCKVRHGNNDSNVFLCAQNSSEDSKLSSDSLDSVKSEADLIREKVLNKERELIELQQRKIQLEIMQEKAKLKEKEREEKMEELEAKRQVDISITARTQRNVSFKGLIHRSRYTYNTI